MFRDFVKYAMVPSMFVILIFIAIFHKPIIRYFTFSHDFEKMVENYGNDTSFFYYKRLLKRGKSIQDDLINVVTDSQSTRVGKYFALYLLGKIKSDIGVKYLIKNLRNPDATVRLGAIRGLKYNMKPEFIDKVEPLLYDPNRLIRYEAVSAIGRVNSAKSLKILYNFTKKERDQLVWYQAWLMLRRLLPVDGKIVDKFRLNKYLQIMPKNDPYEEVGFTYYFLKVNEGNLTLNVNVPREFYKKVKIGDCVKKPSGTSDFKKVECKE